MSTKVNTGAESRKVLLAGIEEVFKAVAPTLGSNGENTVYNKFTGQPVISNDGISIAREVNPSDLGELQGADLTKQVMEETDREVKDATTTTLVLYRNIAKNGVEMIESSDKKINPMRLRKEIISAKEKVLNELISSAIKIDNISELEKIAAVSVEDIEIGKTIANVISKAGESGIVYVSESDTIGVTSEHLDGYQINQGMISPYLLTDFDRMENVMENPAIFMTESLLSMTNELMDMLNKLEGQKVKNLLIICDEVHPDFVKFCVLNRKRMNIGIVKKPMSEFSLEDISSLVGGYPLTINSGIMKPAIEYVGSAEKIVIREKTTTFFNGGNSEYTKSEYISGLSKQADLAKEENNYPAETKLQERIARLTGGVYMINVGGKTEAEQKYLKGKVDDAVGAVKSASGEGFVAGGGSALFHIGSALLALNDLTNGEKLIYSVCQSPLKQIIENSGEVFEDIVFENTPNCGFDASQMIAVPNMIEAGIIDSVKSTRVAFENACNSGALFLTINPQIVPLPEI